MALSDLNIKISYRSSEDNMVRDFYNPVLSEAIKYKRAVGYFTLASLINASQGLSNLISNGGIVEIIASPKLTKEDINTINMGYKMKEDVYLDAMIRELSDITSPVEKEKLNYIATLIADNRLDIKIAVMENYGAYHEKFGLVEDIDGNKIMFTGSMNETSNGQYTNFESFVVFKSWESRMSEYIDEYVENFADLWENKTNRLEVKEFPKAVKEKLLEYRQPTYRDENIPEELELIKDDLIDNKYPRLPDWFKPREYQLEAINNWKANGYNGLLSMATGTGKTLTGLLGLTTLFNSEKKLASIIVCPYQHLVEQWADDVRTFNINPVLCYSKYDWKSQVYRKVKFINNGTIDNFTIITTNSTFTSGYMKEFISQIKCNILLIVDEAHNSSQSEMQAALDNKYKYKLGLSATPKKFRNDAATDFIFSYFGGEVFSFDLKRAIEENYLTKYYYYPHVISLTDDEQERYNDLSTKIAKNIREENGKVIINDFAKNLLIKRARLIAAASNKMSVLKRLLEDYTNKNYILIYCGAAKTTDDNGDKIKQINRVCRILGNEFGISNHKFTAEETPDERKEIIDMFSDGKSLQAIVAIKCLDEGVNIPAIQHAFILASSTDPKEFIQRRGRVLRKYKDKEFAFIHDFVTVPSSYDYTGNLVETELKRVYEFNELAFNKDDNEQLIDELVNNYNVDYESIKNANDKYLVKDDEYE